MNMTTLNFALTRAAGRDFAPGDEILTTALDHDGGVAPWVELAADRGLTVRIADATDELTVDYDDLERKLVDRTRVVAFALASNATGSLADAQRICRLAREAGALSWIDAVHYAAHEPIDVAELGCDVLLCSPYKFCGPHLGIGYTRAEAGGDAGAPTRRGRRSSEPLGRRFETGTLPYELLAGFRATIAYLDSLGGLEVLRDYERTLGERFLGDLPDGVELYGPESTAACRRSCSTSRASTRRLRRTRWPSAGSASGTPTTGTASRSPTGSRAVAARRADPLQHAGRGRPPARGARGPQVTVDRFDAVIVGSGINSLAAGALLARAGWSVCSSSETTGSAARSRPPRSPSPASTTTSSRAGTRSGSAARRASCWGTTSRRGASST